MKFKNYLLFALLIGAPCLSAGAPIKTGIFDQILNPADPADKRTFKQRYLIDSSNAKGNDAPVIYFLGNEGELKGLMDTAGFVQTLSKVLGAHLVGLEHRYYGKSIPFDTLTPETLKYLTVENALSDFARFQTYSQEKFSLRGKWIVIGRSYGAALAAYYRETYPDRVVGAIAAAPAIFWREEWNAFDEREAKVAGPQCVSEYHEKILAPIEEKIKNHEDLRPVKASFKASNIDDDMDFLNALGGTTEFMLQMRGPSSVCPFLSRKDADAAFKTAFFAFLKSEQITVFDFSDQGVMNPASASYEGYLGMRQWYYQTCIELGLFDTPPNDPTRTFQSTLLHDWTTADKECHKVFGIAAQSVDDINRKYYEPLLGPQSQASNIFITNGSYDPTATLSISKENGNDTNPKITIFTVEGGAHHEELNAPKNSDPKSFKDAREAMIQLARKWLADSPAVAR